MRFMRNQRCRRLEAVEFVVVGAGHNVDADQKKSRIKRTDAAVFPSSN